MAACADNSSSSKLLLLKEKLLLDPVKVTLLGHETISDWLHFGIVICSLGALEVLGILFNVICLVVLAKDRRNRGPLTLILQFVAIYDIVYLLCSMADLTAPALWQFLVHGQRNCSMVEYMNIRLTYDEYYSVGMQGVRDVVAWTMIVVAEYTLVPYCCGGPGLKKLFHYIFAVIEIFLMLGFVAAINLFDYMCGGSRTCEADVDSLHAIIIRVNVGLPLGLVFVMYISLIILICCKNSHVIASYMVQIRRGFAVMTLFILCESVYVAYRLYKWDYLPLIGGNKYRDLFEISLTYGKIVFGHINSSMKLLMYMCIGRSFCRIMCFCCCSRDDDDDLDHNDMQPVLRYDRDGMARDPSDDEQTEDDSNHLIMDPDDHPYETLAIHDSTCVECAGVGMHGMHTHIHQVTKV